MWSNAQRDGRPAKYRWRPVLMQRRKVWLASTARLPCSNAANRRVQDLEDAKRILHLAKFRYGARIGLHQLPKCIYSVALQKTAKHRAKFVWLPLSDVAAVMKPRRETR